MGAAQQLDIYGAKSGSEKPKTPTEAPDSLRSVAVAKILIAMGRGSGRVTPLPRTSTWTTPRYRTRRGA